MGPLLRSILLVKLHSSSKLRPLARGILSKMTAHAVAVSTSPIIYTLETCRKSLQVLRSSWGVRTWTNAKAAFTRVGCMFVGCVFECVMGDATR